MAAVKPEDLAALRRVVSPLDRVEEILCSQPKACGYLFAVVRVKSGAYCAVWEREARAFESLEALAYRAAEGSHLNCHEAELLQKRLHLGVEGG